jgi:hypothetical protein
VLQGLQGQRLALDNMAKEDLGVLGVITIDNLL